jgi:uncharacterized protein YdeI (YjbR/CyaY-like superfamily)
MNTINPKVDGYLRKSKKWREESQKLREIVLDCQLTEEVKWRQPCYVFEGRNIVLIQGFKDYCALLFFKGALLKDAKGILEKPGENTQAGRRIPFTDFQQIVKMEPVLKAYIREAIEVEKTGLKVKLKKITQFKIPKELQSGFDEMPELETAFRALTPGRQRAYMLYFSGAKQSTTRESRVEKCAQRILKGKGIDDE